MKTFKYTRFIIPFLVAVFAITLSNCSVRLGTRSSRSSYNAKSLPPGQAKKMNGDKSARNYAPGHNK